ncbi:immune inhibitor A domain-containing protein [Intrasporangium calvum]|uniref:M6 family metalloprotease domain protein n=1 Tax=Intrasporangium calvum (strain ATCC 23552 / DSM 43043 / JCM 3097 / NBRC 12989 / NCIMB 10167 / NRRL B-3866 / 7 KIP) TaxID=710696 RepID=E6SAV7_INTC7|nr:immune inhibitor A domain-containing protein [Intrasporangium calvum]ADU49418.1 M6 family metalloprotease domain protein [Intrasporangium calvum DSM 43043]
MRNSTIARHRRRAVAVVPVIALAAAGLAATSMSGAATAAPADAPTGAPESSGYYINYAAPQVERAYANDKVIGTLGKGKKVDVQDVIARGEAFDRKHAQGNPVTAHELAKLEAKAIKTGKSPKQIKNKEYKNAESRQEAKLLTILVEFNENADDDFSDLYVPEYWGATTCKLGEVVNGPLHNNIPNPADPTKAEDNNSFWVEDFSSEHFDKMLFTDEGITERVRPDLTGPDGEPGIDISGYTMKAMYEEMSKGAYTVSGEATPWIEVDHSEGWYGATRCSENDEGEWEAGAYQGMQGHPDNPIGPGQLPIDAVNKLAEMDPDFPWADYDIEDQGDIDGDGNYDEPDGVIDHVVLVHAGADKSGGGGAEGTYAIWAHSSAVAGGAPIPGTDLKLSNYIVQPEDSGVGVFAHEYGHDLGLPDLYDTGSGGDSDVDFWDLMSSGSHSGPIFQSMPTHMGLWDKWVLGWADPIQMNPGDDAKSVVVGQNSRPLKGTADGVKINLPTKVVTLATPHSGDNMWWSNNDQDWARNTLTRTVDVPDATDAKFWMWNDYVIEEDWDYGFVEVSTDGGSTWTEQKVYDEAGVALTTADGYSDPNGRMADYGGKKYGLTGHTDGWEHHYIDLSGFAGQTVQVRLLIATDAAFLERGWFADDFSVTGAGATTWSDDVESGLGEWTAATSTFVSGSPLGAGWVIDPGTSSRAQYYLVEWRNFDGFDEGLKYAYDTTYNDADGQWKVEKIKYNAPGALVWYRDTSYGNANHVLNNLTALPSGGAKGGLLIVDSHYDPLRRSGANGAADPSTLKNLPSRPQSSNAAFGLRPTYPFKECQLDANGAEVCNTFGPQASVKTFTDDKGWVPGLEFRAGVGFFWRDADASVVVPSYENTPYTTRIVDADGKPVTDLYGADFGFTVAGTGNPADSDAGYGTFVTVAKQLFGNRAAQIKITPPTP